MPIDSISPEAAAVASFPDKIKIPGATPAISADTLTAANRIDKRAKETSAGVVLQEEAARAEQIITRVDQTTTELLLENNFGIKRDATTGKKDLNTDEQLRYDETKKFAEMARLLAEKGYDALPTDPDPNKDQKILARKYVEDALRAFPTVYAAMPTNAGERQLLIEDILRQPDLLLAIKATYAERLSKDKIIPDQVTASEVKKAEADAALSDLDARITTNATTLHNVDTQLDKFGTDPATGNPRADEIELRALTTALSNNKKELAQKIREAQPFQAEADRLRARIDFLGLTGADTTALEAKLTVVEGRLTPIMQRIDALNVDIDRQAELDTIKKNLISEKQRLEQERDALKLKRIETASKQLLASREYSDGLAARRAAETNFAASVENIITVGVTRYQRDRIARVETHRKALIAEDEKNAKDEVAKRIAEARRKRWEKDRKPTRWNKNRTALNRETIQEDYEVLIKAGLTGGPEAAFKKFLSDSGVNAATIDEKMKDQAFIDEHMPKVIGDLLSRKLMSGGIPRNDLASIASTPGGQSAIEYAIQQNSSLTKQVEDLQKKGVLEGNGVSGLLKNKKGLNVIWWLLLFGAAGLAIAGQKGLQNIVQETQYGTT